MNQKPWWEILQRPRFSSNVSLNTSWAFLGLSCSALEEGDAVSASYPGGIPVKSFDELVSSLEGFGGKVIWKRLHSKGNDGDECMISWSHGAVGVDWRKDWLDFTIYSTDEDFFKKVVETCEASIIMRRQSAEVFVMIPTDEGIDLASIGEAGVLLERGNYSTEVIAAFDHVVSDILSVSPCGRLVVLDGPPGGGKTFIVRGLIDAVRNATFVLFPASMVAHADSPELVRALINNKCDGDGPIVLLIEDADACLVPRQADNMASVSSLLNLGDGILGKMLDIRIIATTNAKKVEMDPAAMRSGRLCRRIGVGLLDPDLVQSIYKRLTGNDMPESLVSNKPRSLADVYGMAREGGWIPPAKEDIKAGFSTHAPSVNRILPF